MMTKRDLVWYMGLRAGEEVMFGLRIGLTLVSKNILQQKYRIFKASLRILSDKKQ